MVSVIFVITDGQSKKINSSFIVYIQYVIQIYPLIPHDKNDCMSKIQTPL